ncbi:aldo/keto reductase [Silvimonas iriomotensis]|uniref:Glyceraldehyde 3-phosphate reductase n=1 Tax=Silvimonas iriomotensis TaxID=449662 RepID=A0ABQ2PA02_9NEIS|nr:aldo/keto reductase [Silvimonas iriomotensis]GGP21766.1 glyceraldehyde 3-phosphate reductase [Silvimonas iriomotensis]
MSISPEVLFRRCGHSGVKLPAVSLGLWHNFGDNRAMVDIRAMLHRALDLGVVHMDLANNYGPPPGSAETRFGEVLSSSLRGHRHELFISTKAGYVMWPGPYGNWGSRKSLLASLDQSLKRMRLDHVDLFYSHRPDPETPVEETMAALDAAVRQGKARYVGLSNYTLPQTIAAVTALKQLGTPCLIHQARYSMFERWVEGGLVDYLKAEGIGLIAFSPLAQGLLTDRYLDGLPEGSRAMDPDSPFLTPEKVLQRVAKARQLNALALARGQSLAQMALAWVLRNATSAIIGASRVAQIEHNLAALNHTAFGDDEIARIEAILAQAD